MVSPLVPIFIPFGGAQRHGALGWAMSARWRAAGAGRKQRHDTMARVIGESFQCWTIFYPLLIPVHRPRRVQGAQPSAHT
jgi:hypothetical protein